MLKTIYNKAPSFFQCIENEDKRSYMSFDCIYFEIEPLPTEVWAFQLRLVSNKNWFFQTKMNELKQFLDKEVSLKFQTLDSLVTFPKCTIKDVNFFIYNGPGYKDFEEDEITTKGIISGDFYLKQIADYPNNQIHLSKVGLEEAYAFGK